MNFTPRRVLLLVAHVKDFVGVVAGYAGQGEAGEDDGDDAGGHEARLEGILGGRVVVLREVVEAGEDDPGEGDVLGHVEVEAEDVTKGLNDKNNEKYLLIALVSKFTLQTREKMQKFHTVLNFPSFFVLPTDLGWMPIHSPSARIGLTSLYFARVFFVQFTLIR